MSFGDRVACAALVGAVGALAVLSSRGAVVAQSSFGATAPNLLVAFIGDDGNNFNTSAVLQLIENEGADLVIDQGDFDYVDTPTQWDDRITNVLGADFPYFATVGNHDVARFYGAGGYQEKLMNRLARLPGSDVQCVGELSVKAACVYKGLFFLQSGVGTLGTNHEQYLDQLLTSNQSIWRICSWHKNQRAMQVGGKLDEVGWLAYETCRARGAIIAQGHEHSYSRTKTLVNMTNQTVDPAWPLPTELRVVPGATFAFVAGLGGREVRDQERCLPITYPYGCKGEWAKIYTSNQSAQFGALFIEFNINGDPNKARGYFKNISGIVVDEFEIISEIGLPSTNTPPDVTGVTITSGPPNVEGSQVGVEATFTEDDSGDLHTATISWGDGSSTTGIVNESLRTVSGSHAYIDDGSYTVTVSVTDSHLGTDSGSTVAAVINVPPTANAGGPYQGVAESPITFSGSAIDPGTADLLTYQWDLDNNGTFETTGKTVQAAFLIAGNFTVNLRVLDNDSGTSNVASAPVSVTPKPAPPPPPPVRLYFSLESSATIAGLSVANEDIVSFDGTAFRMFFDGSDVGASSFAIDAFAIISPTELLMSFTAAGTVGGVAMDDSDIVKFSGTFGPTTSGSFSMYFDGSDVGLTSSGENIDAIEVLANGRILVSTTGSLSVSGASGAREDLFEFTPTSLGSTTAGTWRLYFDGSDVALSSSNENIDGVAVDSSGRIYLSTTGAFAVAGASGQDEDVFVFTPTALGSNTAGTFTPTLFFDGSQFGLSSRDLFAIEIP